VNTDILKMSPAYGRMDGGFAKVRMDLVKMGPGFVKNQPHPVWVVPDSMSLRPYLVQMSADLAKVGPHFGHIPLI
jgi:hypothetical protein